MNSDLMAILAILSPIASIAFGYFAFRRNNKIDDSASAREMGMILTEVGYIKSQMDALNRKMEYSDTRYTQVVERVSAVEQCAKSAHHRIDGITGVAGNE